MRLKGSRSEVYNRLLIEFDEKEYKKRLYRDGVQDGIEQGIEVLIKVLQKQGKSCEDIEEILQEEYGLSEKDVQQYMEKYWRF